MPSATSPRPATRPSPRSGQTAAETAVPVAGRVLSTELTPDDHRRLLDAAIRELPAAGANGHGGQPRMTDADPPAATVEVEIRDDTVIAVARRYAEALIDAAQKEGQVDDGARRAGGDRRRRLRAVPPVRRRCWPRSASRPPSGIASSPRCSAAGRPTWSLRFLRVLNRHGRLGLLRPIVAEARTIWDRRNRRIPVSVRSAVPLDDDQIQALRDRLQGLVAGTPILSVSTDPSLIGGLVVQVGDQLYDASVKSRLATAPPSPDRREDA